MRLAALKRHWDRLGTRDPQWAALTHPDKRHAKWDLEEFFRSGSEEVAAVLARADRLGIAVSRRRALDFGCGAGRVTQALAAAFDRADGVDIAASMLDEARRHNHRPDRCFYHLNVAADLSLFPDATFSFVYSTLVLQHMEPRYSRHYIGELLRVLAPGGLLVFQVPARRLAPEPTEDAARTPVAGRLPATACRARLSADVSSVSAQADDQITLRVTVENRSTSVWPALPNAWGDYRINVANHWLHEDGEIFVRDDARCPLTHDLAPGSRADLIVYVTAPPHDGTYWIELDLVQENVGWFAERGSDTYRVRCQVTGGLPGPAPRRPVVAPVAEPDRPPFRLRHPRAFRVLSATHVRDAYWAWRHGLDAIKRRRDRAIWWLKDRAYEPVVPPLVNWWTRLSFAPRMEMHCVPRAEVTALVAAHGGRLVAVDEELTTGGYESCRYWVVKD